MLQLGDSPIGTNLPEEQEEKIYIFEVHGEVHIEATSKEEAKQELKNNLKEHLYDAYHNDDLLID